MAFVMRTGFGMVLEFYRYTRNVDSLARAFRETTRKSCEEDIAQRKLLRKLSARMLSLECF